MKTPRSGTFVARLSVVCAALLFVCVLCVGEVALADEASGDWQKNWDTVQAAAKKEGAVNVAGPPQAAERSVIAKFREAYPGIELRYTGLSSGNFLSRLALERQGGTYEWDVMIGGPSSLSAFIDRGFFQPIVPLLILPEVTDSNKWLGGIKGGFQDPEQRYVYAFTTYISRQIKINRTVIPEGQLENVEQLLDPKWKGKIVFYDPRVDGAGSTSLATLYKLLGEDKMKTLLIDQQPVFSTDKRQFTEWLVRGQYPIGIGIIDGYLAPFLAQGVGKDVKNLKLENEVLTIGSGTLIAVDRNPHPNATKVFVNWLLSQAVQSDWAKTAATNSRRLDVLTGPAETRPDPAELDNYINFSQQANYRLKVQTQAMARALRP